MDPAAEFPEPNDDQQAPGAGPTALPPGRHDGSERKVTVSFTVAMKQFGPPRAIHEARRLVAAPAGATIGERILRWLRGPARPPITKAAQLPEPEQTAARDASSRPPAVSFLAALDSAEREALEAVAVSQRFAAGETLMREGDKADHVMVIIEGRTEVCVDENGWERVLAERGPGELVGERGRAPGADTFRQRDRAGSGAGPDGADRGLPGLCQCPPEGVRHRRATTL